MTIVDACRGVGTAERYNFAAKAVALANLSEGTIVAYNAKEGRSSNFEQLIANRAYVGIQREAAWDKALARSYTGIVEMLACAKGQGAGEDATAGGYYTSLLLASADIWSKTANTSPIHTTKNAHDYAAENLPPQQTPEYSPAWLAYPFAVKS